MNKLITSLLVFTFPLFAISCDDEEKVIPETDLPQAARNFIALHFPQQTIKLTVRDEESIEFEVWLDDEFSLEFNEAGNWNEINSRGTAIPASIINELPESLTTYLSENYATYTVVKLEIEGSFYEVKLSNQLELIFDGNGNFLRLDD